MRTVLRPGTRGVATSLQVAAALQALLLVALGVQLFRAQVGFASDHVMPHRVQVEVSDPPHTALVLSHVPRGDSVVLVTPSKDYVFGYFQLQYALLPRGRVTWVVPARRRSPVDWWITEPTSGRGLAALAREHRAKYILLQEVTPPPDLPTTASWTAPAQTLVRVADR